MIVSTLKELSKWGTTMGATLLGFWTFTLCSFPYAIATGGLVLKVGLAGVAAVPLLIMRGPAHVSSSCDDLLDQLNEISFLGGLPHKQRCGALRNSLLHLNAGQGLGFKIFATVVDKRTLWKAATLVGGGATSVIAALVSVAHSADEAERRQQQQHFNESILHGCECP
jgi:hypothetical protein